MEVLQPEVVAALLEILLQGGGGLANLGVLAVVLEGVGEDEENVAKKVVDGLVIAAFDATLDGPHVHRVVDHVKVVGILQGSSKIAS